MGEANRPRPARELIHMSTAVLWASRSLCKRLRVGAVLTDESMRRVLSVGYNGPGRNLPHDRCSDEEGRCGCLHAEDNAIAMAVNEPRMRLFVTHQPCEQCAQRIMNCGIESVRYLWTYRKDDGAQLLASHGIDVQRVDEALVERHLTLQASLTHKALQSPST